MERRRPPSSSEQSSAGSSSHKSAASLRVIADHSRAATFLISDGVLPSNEGRGYVLRKIIRRAITHGRLLGQTKPFLHEMVFAVRDLMQDAYPELKETAERVSKTFSSKKHDSHTLSISVLRGWRISLKTSRGQRSRPGAEAFKLYDTFGMPLDFMQDAARDQGIEFDQAGFDRAMEEQRSRARAHGRAGPNTRPILRTRSFRNQSSKATGRRAPRVAKCSRSFITDRV